MTTLESPISSMPNDVLLDVFGFLPPHDIGRCASVSKRFRRCSENESLWKKLLANKGREHLRTDQSAKQAYLDRFCVFEQQKTIRIHSGRVCSMAIHKNLLFSNCSNDNTLNIRNLTTGYAVGSIFHTFKGFCKNQHTTHHVTSLVFHKNLIYCGSTDKNIYVNNLNRKIIAVLKGHTNKVSSLAIHNDLLCSGSSDSTIRVWDLNTRKQIHVLNDYQEISSLASHNNLLCSGYNDNTIGVWDLNTYKKVDTLDGNGFGAPTLAIHENLLLSGFYGGIIDVWNLNPQRHIHTLRGHNHHRVCALTIHENLLISGAYDNAICVWDLNTYERIYAIINLKKVLMKLWQSSAHKLVVYDHRLYVGDERGNISVWKKRLKDEHQDEIDASQIV